METPGLPAFLRMVYELRIAIFYDEFTLDWTGCRGLDDYGHDCAVYVAFFGLERFNTAQQSAMFVPQFIMSRVYKVRVSGFVALRLSVM